MMDRTHLRLTHGKHLRWVFSRFLLVANLRGALSSRALLVWESWLHKLWEPTGVVGGCLRFGLGVPDRSRYVLSADDLKLAGDL